MRTDLAVIRNHQIFLNYPFDDEFEPLAHAIHFAVVAAGLLPVCALDLTVPDRPRLEILVEAIASCQYSVHDLSKGTGEGVRNFARLNMPIEMGMALFHALHTRRVGHRCAFFVAAPHEYQAYASDLAGLDPRCYENDETILVANVYDWLRSVVPEQIFNNVPTASVRGEYLNFKDKLEELNGNSSDGRPNHDEAQELMYQVCSDLGWWDWRETRVGRAAFPTLPLSWKNRST